MDRSWLKNFLFLAVIIGSLTALAWTLFPSKRIADPSRFDREWYSQPGVAETIRKIDYEFEKSWSVAEVEHAGIADDLIIARRLALGLMGTVPSLEEIRMIQRQPEDQRINWWVSRILEDRRFSDYVGERFARAFVGVENGPFLIYRRRRFVSWLSDRILENRPYDELVGEMLTAEGLWTSSPEVNFYTVTTDQDGTDHPDPIRLAGRTSRALLGMRIDCVQCHDDFLGNVEFGSVENRSSGTQQNFHELAAFFSQVQNSIGGVRDQKRSDPYKYQYLDENEEQVVQPSVPFSSELLPPIDGSRRKELAAWVTHPENRAFARAIINRTWAMMFGRPLVTPVDDIPLFGQYPPGMTTLVDDFITHDFDLHRLIRVIAMTRVFRLDSQAEFEVLPEHDRNWAIFPLTRLRPEQVAGAIIQSTALSTIDSTSHALVRLGRFGQESDFVTRYGDMGEDEFDEKGETVTQRLIMLNGQMIGDRISDGTSAAQSIANLSPNATKAVETAYLAVLSRLPTEDERLYFSARLNQNTDSPIEQVQDLYWVLINSGEFAWNH